MAIALVFIFFLSVFWNVFTIRTTIDRSTLPHNQINWVVATINTFNQHFNTSTPQFHVQALGPE